PAVAGGSGQLRLPAPVFDGGNALTGQVSVCIICGFPDSVDAKAACTTGLQRGKYPDSSHINEVHMYAVIKTGGKQYKVAAGEKFKVEQIPADIGSEITLDQVLAVGAGDSLKFGSPLVEGAKV